MQDTIIRNSSRLDLTIRIADIVALWFVGQLARMVRFSAPLNESAPVHTILLYTCCALALWLFSQFDIYSSWRGRSMPSMFAHLAAAWAVVLLIGLVFSFLIHHVGDLSRLWLFYWFIIGLVVLGLSRVLLYSTLRYMRAKGGGGGRGGGGGDGHTGREMHKRAAHQHWSGYDVKAVHTCGAAITDPIDAS